jgi:SAM-dependent methyltransferase
VTTPDAPLHDLNPTGRFSDRAAEYVKFRPGYPPAAIDAILDGLGDPISLLAADVGAGTGISARLLADRGVRVVAVEPNAEMRAAAAPHPRVTWHEGTAESTDLDPNSVGLVLCAQSFHWFKQPEALAEFARILRPGGRLALMWNERDRSDPFMTAYRNAIRAAGGEHPAEMRQFDPRVIEKSGLFGPVRLVEMPSSQLLDEAGLIGRAMSASYVPRQGERAEQLVSALRDLQRRHRDTAGAVVLRYITRVWMAERTQQ